MSPCELDCLFNSLFIQKWTVKRPSEQKHYLDLCEGNSPVNSLHQWPVMQKASSCHDVIMHYLNHTLVPKTWNRTLLLYILHQQFRVSFLRTKAHNKHCLFSWKVCFYSSAYHMCPWIESALVQAMPFHQVSAKPLPESMNAEFLSLGPTGKNFSEVLIKIQQFSIQ